MLTKKENVTIHQAIQDILAEVLKEFGIEARSELLNVDVIAKNDNKIVTIEIETTGNNQNRNIEKCLFLNPKKHIHIFIDTEPTEDVLRHSNEENVKVLVYKINKPKINNPEQKEAFEIFKEIVSKKIPIKEQIREFKERTGYSRATFFNYKKRLAVR